MKRPVLIAWLLLASAPVFAEGHEGEVAAPEPSAEEAPAASILPRSIERLMRPRHRQSVHSSKAEALAAAEASCKALLAERQETSFYGFWASAERERQRAFPGDIAHFSQRHAENSVHCARVSMEAGYAATDGERLSILRTNVSASALALLTFPMSFLALASEDTRLPPGQWAGISQVRMTCEPRPEEEVLILSRALECGQMQRRIGRTHDAAERRALEDARPTYCDGIFRAAQGIRPTEFVPITADACILAE